MVLQNLRGTKLVKYEISFRDPFYHLSKDFRDLFSETDIEIFSMTPFVSKFILVTPYGIQKYFVTPKSPPPPAPQYL